MDTIVGMVQTTQKLEQQTLAAWFTRPEADHAAQFYANDSNLGVCALEYVYSGLRYQEMCVVIATPEKLINIQKGLRRRGVDINSELAKGRYITYDAEALLAEFMDDREIDLSEFNASMDRLVRHVASAKWPVRIFGEMTALLRQQKNPAALLHLEHALDRLSRSYRLSLYCAYPVSDGRGEHGEIHKHIQETHDHIFYC
jgi:hypothetical protein